MTTQVRFISATPEGEKIMLYCARVSNPKNQDSLHSNLLGYCIRNEHWSVFEMADMTVEITTSVAVSRQILRHRSFCFQEFSQRYAVVAESETFDLRRQHPTNRQSSIVDNDLDMEFQAKIRELDEYTRSLYFEMLAAGVAKESARMILPMASTTRLYMKGSVRSWIHYLKVRTHESTQAEHREVAELIKVIFTREFPHTAEAL
jgi:thymidylate synthase (FAD)